MKLSNFKAFLPVLRHTNFWVLPMFFFREGVPIKIFNKDLSFYILDMKDVFVLKEIILEDRYQKYVHMKKNDIVVDIGCGIGEFTLFASKIAKQVYGFDPDIFRVNLATKNMKLNKIKNVTFIKKAVTSLDDLFKTYKIGHCNFLKVDCEGWEYEIFKNTSVEALKKVENISMELHIFDEEMRKDYHKLKKHLEKYFEIYEDKNEDYSRLRHFYAHNKSFK